MQCALAEFPVHREVFHSNVSTVHCPGCKSELYTAVEAVLRHISAKVCRACREAPHALSSRSSCLLCAYKTIEKLPELRPNFEHLHMQCTSPGFPARGSSISSGSAYCWLSGWGSERCRMRKAGPRTSLREPGEHIKDLVLPPLLDLHGFLSFLLHIFYLPLLVNFHQTTSSRLLPTPSSSQSSRTMQPVQLLALLAASGGVSAAAVPYHDSIDVTVVRVTEHGGPDEVAAAHADRSFFDSEPPRAPAPTPTLRDQSSPVEAAPYTIKSIYCGLHFSGKPLTYVRTKGQDIRIVWC